LFISLFIFYFLSCPGVGTESRVKFVLPHFGLAARQGTLLFERERQRGRQLGAGTENSILGITGGAATDFLSGKEICGNFWSWKEITGNYP